MTSCSPLRCLRTFPRFHGSFPPPRTVVTTAQARIAGSTGTQEAYFSYEFCYTAFCSGHESCQHRAGRENRKPVFIEQIRFKSLRQSFAQPIRYATLECSQPRSGGPNRKHSISRLSNWCRYANPATSTISIEDRNC